MTIEWQETWSGLSYFSQKMFIPNLCPLVTQNLIAFGDKTFKEMSKLNQVKDIP